MDVGYTLSESKEVRAGWGGGVSSNIYNTSLNNAISLKNKISSIFEIDKNLSEFPAIRIYSTDQENDSFQYFSHTLWNMTSKDRKREGAFWRAKFRFNTKDQWYDHVQHIDKELKKESEQSIFPLYLSECSFNENETKLEINYHRTTLKNNFAKLMVPDDNYKLLCFGHEDVFQKYDLKWLLNMVRVIQSKVFDEEARNKMYNLVLKEEILIAYMKYQVNLIVFTQSADWKYAEKHYKVEERQMFLEGEIEKAQGEFVRKLLNCGCFDTLEQYGLVKKKVQVGLFSPAREDYYWNHSIGQNVLTWVAVLNSVFTIYLLMSWFSMTQIIEMGTEFNPENVESYSKHENGIPVTLTKNFDTVVDPFMVVEEFAAVFISVVHWGLERMRRRSMSFDISDLFSFLNTVYALYSDDPKIYTHVLWILIAARVQKKLIEWKGDKVSESKKCRYWLFIFATLSTYFCEEYISPVKTRTMSENTARNIRFIDNYGLKYFRHTLQRLAPLYMRGVNDARYLIYRDSTVLYPLRQLNKKMFDKDDRFWSERFIIREPNAEEKQQCIDLKEAKNTELTNMLNRIVQFWGFAQTFKGKNACELPLKELSDGTTKQFDWDKLLKFK